MIRYTLRCAGGHRFESWFGDSDAFERLVRARLISCPQCESVDVAKAIMAPAVVSHHTTRPGDAPSVPVPVGPPARAVDAEAPNARATIRGIREKILAETRDVGRAFPEEARPIHEGGGDFAIRGEATLADARDLLEEGILVLPVPPDSDRLD